MSCDVSNEQEPVIYSIIKYANHPCIKTLRLKDYDNFSFVKMTNFIQKCVN